MQWYWEKRWLFSIGNGAEIRSLEKGRKSPVRTLKDNLLEIDLFAAFHHGLHYLLRYLKQFSEKYHFFIWNYNQGDRS